MIDLLAYLQFNVESILEQNKLVMDKHQINGHVSLPNGSDEDFELMGDMPKEDPVIIEVNIFKQDFIDIFYNSILASSFT